MKKLSTVLVALIICNLLVKKESWNIIAQDIHFSQFYMAPLNQNPALAGATYGMAAELNYKTQWKSFGAPYKTVNASYDMGFQKKKRAKSFFAAGINFFSDKAGDSKMGISQVNITAAGHVYTNRYSKLGGGIQIGYAQKSVDYAALQWGNQFDGMYYNASLSSKEMVTGAASASYVDVGAGVVWTYDNNAGFKRVVDNNDFKATLGASVYHISQPRYSFNNSTEKLFAKFVLHGNFLLSVPYTSIGFVPGFIVYKQGPATEIYAGSLVRYVLKQKSRYTGYKNTSAIAAGAYYRAKDAAVISILLEQANYSIGMSYDINVSRLRVASVGRGGFELSLRYTASNPFITRSRSRF